ncbi:hypothetical protein [Nocardia otitidiscaviarum]|uniref:hypothetical protein n=1 Tax=Nocardia otitidiscaviarum TaxID=1823 RepID=UPI0011DE11AD|nr:hypothetical protein [Nocardia otitidiscaviarum]
MSLLHTRGITHPVPGAGYPVRYEPVWGWTVRPEFGWRSHRWMPPLHWTRRIPRSEQEAATDWALERMGL